MNTSDDCGPSKMSAILLTSITYIRCELEGEISVPAHTLIQVDTENSIALIGLDHVSIDTHEYKIFAN